MQTIDYRYNNDAQVHALVDSLEHMIRNLQFTPSEVRDCAMLATIHYEQRRPPQVKIGAVDNGATTAAAQNAADTMV
jgi:hypothetical protein